MTASFRFLAFLSFAPSSLSPLSRPAGLLLTPEDWVEGEPVLPIWTATSPRSANNAALVFIPAPSTHTHFGFPKACFPGGRRAPPP